ncbi:MAG: molybdenum cofactor synthesis protein [Lentisphaerae bacterium]|nr:molybdenum cofactor synthesis protein [Lentisphaerota bacterium]
MRVLSVNVSAEKGTPKRPVPEIRIDEAGVAGDAHAGPWHRQVSILSREIIAEFEPRLGREIKPGELAENVTVEGADLRAVCMLDRFLSEGLELEVTQIGKACHGDGCAIFREIGACVMPGEGVFCRVIRGGSLRPGDRLEHRPRALRIGIVTMSDRASRGVYEDRGGPRIRELTACFLRERRWRPEFEMRVLPDERPALVRELEAARDRGLDVVFTTGGTGIGPRDVTPEAVQAVADKVIPGIMEHIRVKYGAEKPNALLSRSVAAVARRTLIYALPGSVKAVEEYVPEILRTLEHLVLTLHAVDHHP